MQKKYLHLCTFIFLSLPLIVGCGRKQRNFLYFPPEKSIHITKLDLPAVKGLNAQLTDIGIHVSWLPLFTEKTPQQIKSFEKNFVGFDLFRLENNATFIPKKPINENPITDNYFLDKRVKSSKHTAYTVQPLFKFETQILHGPSSQIIKVSN